MPSLISARLNLPPVLSVTSLVALRASLPPLITGLKDLDSKRRTMSLVKLSEANCYPAWGREPLRFRDCKPSGWWQRHRRGTSYGKKAHAFLRMVRLLGLLLMLALSRRERPLLGGCLIFFAPRLHCLMNPRIGTKTAERQSERLPEAIPS